MGLDIRWPIGLMFTLIGVLLAIYGVAKPPTPSRSASTSTSSGASCCSCSAC